MYLFVCMSTKALPIELVSDMFALRRFMSRRGKPSQIFLDNGKNFVGARNELNKIYIMLNNKNSCEEIKSFAANDGIKWTFIPPAAPHWGGIWEAGVKSVKHHLRRTMGNNTLTYEELNTLLIQIEGILNSRPLCPLGSYDLDCLTPSHFLIGPQLTALPEDSTLVPNVPINKLSAFKQIKHLKESFWSKWSKDYLSTLQQRRKWTTQVPWVEKDSIVLVKEENLPPQQWSVARVFETIPGKDGLIRTVKIKTKDGVYVRPITKICVLPIDS